jgi:hypothetical protein
LVKAFHDGVALNYDNPEISRTPDWQADIQRDTAVQPIPVIDVRFLLIHDSHLTGSGWR